jgi:hypothetical protein
MNIHLHFEPEGMRRRAQAGIVRLRVGLALIDDARRGGGFETDEAKLGARVAEILESLRAAGSNPGAVVVEAEPVDAESVHLSTPTDEHGSDNVVLRADGVLLDRFSSSSAVFEAVDVDELTPAEQEKMRAAEAEYEAEMARPRFEGGRFLRALACEPRPGAEVQLLAVELFDDGFVVHYTFNQTQEEFERAVEEDPFDEHGGPPGLRVEDDLGTEYHRGSGGGGHAGAVRSSYEFAPAVPEGAHVLRVSTTSGTVELFLQS